MSIAGKKIKFTYATGKKQNIPEKKPCNPEPWITEETLTYLGELSFDGKILTVRYTGEDGIEDAKTVDLSALQGNEVTDFHLDRTNNLVLTQKTGESFTVPLPAPEPVDLTGKADIDGGNITNVLQWRNNIDVYSKDTVDDKFYNGSTESLTEITQPTLTGNILSIKYRGENGVEQVRTLDLSGLATIDIHINDASYDASSNILSLSDNVGNVYTVDLSEFSIITMTNPSGITTVIQEGVTKLVLSKVGQTGNYNDLNNLPPSETLDSVAIRGNISSVPIGVRSPDYMFDYNSASNTRLMGASVGEFYDGVNNFIVGSTLPNITTSSSNSVFGAGSLTNIIRTTSNTAIGSRVLRYLDKDTTGNSYGTNYGGNTGIGDLSLQYCTIGKMNISIGGGQSQPNGKTDGSEVHIGKHNISVGTSALNNARNAHQNIGIGNGTASYIVDGVGNIVIGYSSALGLRNGNNNIFIGNGSGGTTQGTPDVSNKLCVENRIYTVSQTSHWDSRAGGAFTDYKKGLISGDFIVREVNIDGVFSTSPAYMPNADGDLLFTKTIVAKEDGTFGWQTRSTAPVLTTTPNNISRIRLTSDFSSIAVARANVPNFNFTVEAGKVYKIKIFGAYSTGVLTTGGSMGFVLGGGGVGKIFGTLKMNILHTNVASPEQVITDINAISTTVRSFGTSTGVGTINIPEAIDAELIFECTTSGTFNVQWGTEIANSSAILLKNSILEVIEI